ncbi:MAG: MBL fold metallo-hydrolase [Gomphosphaeria aponina SAG 52.96 = DSM 107014]|uniref:MBL fold metallo-hydrolase n=1 Tax=Gomphosphaeria aponina SAG 52.96 = DSM 107014 TaxID=1521640 RepID=A0A941GVB2_9CHRO|nr:MBL fold metallo-hydrolase [Gomphosphaeria aponina SAG 52.96 = DSM 107014]
MQLTWLDSNSWLIEMGGKRILLDPWLVGPLVFANLPWLFKANRTTERLIPDNIDLILLSQGLEDHAHPPTLKLLDHNLPVIASPNAAKVVQELGYTQITSLAHGETFTFEEQLIIKALPGSPIGPMLVENGYFLQDLTTNQTLYYEPHGYHKPAAITESVNVAIAPIVSLTIPLLGPVIQGHQTALDLCKSIHPQFILPTAAGGDVVFEGLLMSLLRPEGSVDEFRAKLVENHLSTQLITPRPGEPVTF